MAAQSIMQFQQVMAQGCHNFLGPQGEELQRSARSDRVAGTELYAAQREAKWVLDVRAANQRSLHRTHAPVASREAAGGRSMDVRAKARRLPGLGHQDRRASSAAVAQRQGFQQTVPEGADVALLIQHCPVSKMFIF